jgi:NAD(P)-dependent dehydrogenase (short-subunit alcohol dehydrogenase family)
MPDRYLSGRAAWVTGGASGMGRACAKALADAGADVAIGSLLADAQGDVLPEQVVYLPTDSELADARAELGSRGARVYAASLDLRSDESVERFFSATVDAFGKVDILVNAAGTWGDQPMVGHPDEFWHRMIDVNLNGPYCTIRRVLPGMIERGWGRIVNVGSTAATEGERHNAAYCAAKHGLLGLTRCVALESAPHGVTCNMVSPGHVDTTASRLSTRLRGQRATDEPVDDLVAKHAAAMIQGRLIQPDEIAATVAFLCREDARSFTMENIRQSGGMLW